MRIIVVLSMLFLVLVAPARGADEFRTLSTDELSRLVDSSRTLTLVDARTPEEYDEAHIKGAVNIPEKGFDTASKQLPAEKTRLVVIYCNGVKCGKSRKVAKLVAPLGYSNIAIYGDGFPVWEEKGLPIKPGPGYGARIQTRMIKPAEIKALVLAAAKDVVIVDVRDDIEYGEGHIPSAINIPVEQFAARSGVLPKESRIIVYCNTGSRSYNAYRKLVKLAYPNIGQTLFSDWKDAGYPVAR